MICLDLLCEERELRQWNYHECLSWKTLWCLRYFMLDLFTFSLKFLTMMIGSFSVRTETWTDPSYLGLPLDTLSYLPCIALCRLTLWGSWISLEQRPERKERHGCFIQTFKFRDLTMRSCWSRVWSPEPTKIGIKYLVTIVCEDNFLCARFDIAPKLEILCLFSLIKG